jgi:hypothetical protein
MKKIIAGGIAAAAIAVIPGVALASPALADAHGFDPQQIHAVLQNLGQHGEQGNQQQATTQDADTQQAPMKATPQQQAPTQDADAQQAPAQDTTTKQQPAALPANTDRSISIFISGLGVKNSVELVEFRGPADRMFNGGHSMVGQKGVGEFGGDVKAGALPGIVHAKWNVTDPNNALTDTIDMDLVVKPSLPKNLPEVDIENVRLQNMTGGVNPVVTSGKHFDVLGSVVDYFFRNS